jgi:hypothetical protein
MKIILATKGACGDKNTTVSVRTAAIARTTAATSLATELKAFFNTAS